MTPDATRRRAIGQILLLAAGFLVLVAISVGSVLLVNKARDDNAWVVHTVEVENQINALLLEIRRAESAARGYLLTCGPRFPDRARDRGRQHHARRRQAGAADRRQSGPGRKRQASCARRSRPGSSNSRARSISSSRTSRQRPSRWCARPPPTDTVQTIARVGARHARRGRPAVRAAHRERRPHARYSPPP